jgi:hypothetical protein
VRRTDGEIRYVDYVDTAALRAHDAYHPDVTDIVEVDAVWNGSRLADAVGTGSSADYVIAVGALVESRV